MDRKKLFLTLGKILAAGCMALAVLTCFCCSYYNLPVHSSCADGATDYIWEKNTFYSRWTEGLSWGWTNNEGYFNLIDYSPNMPIYALIMGSSHMEARNVFPKESTADRLASRWTDKTVYNIGISGHTLPVCLSNLSAAVEKYRPTDYVIIETSGLIFNETQLENVLNGELEDLPSYSGGIIGLLQQNQFLRLCYAQLTYFRDSYRKSKATAPAPEPVLTPRAEELLDVLFQRAAETAGSTGAKIIILYQPSTELGDNGQLITPEDAEQRAIFSALCEKNGLIFLDMTDRFHAEYESRYVLPHGFANSSIGSGHLNSEGHAMIADELYKIMEEGA